MIATPYVMQEVFRNLQYLPATGSNDWVGLRAALVMMNDVLTLDRPSIFGPTKDRPILFGALAWADVLLTLDRTDFGDLMNKPSYGLPVQTPAMFLRGKLGAGEIK